MSQSCVTIDGPKAVLRPAGDLLTTTTGDIRSQLKQALQSGVREIEVDLAAVRVVDSAGIGLLIATHNSLRKTGGALSVVNVAPDVLELFRSVRLHQHFTVTGR